MRSHGSAFFWQLWTAKAPCLLSKDQRELERNNAQFSSRYVSRNTCGKAARFRAAASPLCRPKYVADVTRVAGCIRAVGEAALLIGRRHGAPAKRAVGESGLRLSGRRARGRDALTSAQVGQPAQLLGIGDEVDLDDPALGAIVNPTTAIGRATGAMTTPAAPFTG
jgi:hypothetical protein